MVLIEDNQMIETFSADTSNYSFRVRILYLYITHEMYHRGQISIYERLMQIEPALTAKLREFLAVKG